MSESSDDEYVTKIKASTSTSKKYQASALPTCDVDDLDDNEESFFRHAKAASETNYVFNYASKTAEVSPPESDQTCNVVTRSKIQETPIVLLDDAVSDDPIVELGDEEISKRPLSPLVNGSTDELRYPEADTSVGRTDLVLRIKIDGKIQRFATNKHDNLESVFTQLADQLKTSVDNVVLLRGSEQLSSHHVPFEIGLRVTDFLEVILRSTWTDESSDEPTCLIDPDNRITLKFQPADRRQTIELVLNKLNNFNIIKQQYAKKRELDASSIKLHFDGELIDDTSTPASLEMEDDDCIDVLQ